MASAENNKPFQINKRPKDDESDSDGESNDLTIFTLKGTDCSIVDNECNIKHCQYLQRLVIAMRMSMDLKDDKFLEFSENVYGHQLLDDYDHLLSSHGEQLDEIKNELLSEHGFAACSPRNCEFSVRHFSNGRREEKDEDGHTLFYKEQYDSLHLNLFHLYEIGYRFRFRLNLEAKEKEEDHDDHDDTKCVDHEFAEMVSKVHGDRDKYHDTFGRFESESTNKYNLNLNVNVDGNDNKTFLDRLFSHIRTQKVEEHDVDEIGAFIKRQHYDSEAVQEDVEDEDGNTSNIHQHAKNKKLVPAIRAYIARSKGMQ